jgi:Actin and related proteins
VIDVGETMASVTPVVDGFVLRKGSSFYKFEDRTSGIDTFLKASYRPHYPNWFTHTRVTFSCSQLRIVVALICFLTSSSLTSRYVVC